MDPITNPYAPGAGQRPPELAGRDEQLRTFDVVLERIRNGERGDKRLAGLTDQERRVLTLIGEGLTNRQIAAEMFLSEKTVKNYVTTLMRKLGLERRTQVAILATKLDT